MRKQHESMYYFSFDTANNDYRTLYIYGTANWDTLNVSSVFAVNLMDARDRYTNKEIEIISKTTYLKDLNKVLINWCRILTDKIIETQTKRG